MLPLHYSMMSIRLASAADGTHKSGVRQQFDSCSYCPWWDLSVGTSLMSTYVEGWVADAVPNFRENNT